MKLHWIFSYDVFRKDENSFRAKEALSQFIAELCARGDEVYIYANSERAAEDYAWQKDNFLKNSHQVIFCIGNALDLITDNNFIVVGNKKFCERANQEKNCYGVTYDSVSDQDFMKALNEVQRYFQPEPSPEERICSWFNAFSISSTPPLSGARTPNRNSFYQEKRQKEHQHQALETRAIKSLAF